MDIITKINSYLQNSIDSTKNRVLFAKWIDTILGPMMVISDEKALYLLEFAEKKYLEKEIQNIIIQTKANILLKDSEPIISIEQELQEYFTGHLKQFKTLYHLLGTDFQKSVWQALEQIPYGHTRSYQEQARIIDRANAVRAVGSSNGKNQLSIIIPCHRVINNNGKLGGYGGGMHNKKWLLEHEAKYA